MHIKSLQQQVVLHIHENEDNVGQPKDMKNVIKS